MFKHVTCLKLNTSYHVKNSEYYFKPAGRGFKQH